MKGRSALQVVATYIFFTLVALAGASGEVSDRGPGSWTPEEVREVLDQTLIVRLAPSLDSLTPAESAALDDLLAAGEIMHRLYLEQRHPEALAALAGLEAAAAHDEPSAAATELLDLYRIFKGPVGTTLDNERRPFLDVEEERPGKNVYPGNIGRDEVRDFLNQQPAARDLLLDPRTVVRRGSRKNLEVDLETLDRFPALDVLHPELRGHLAALAREPEVKSLYAIPYSVAYAGELHAAHLLLRRAASKVRQVDSDLSAYLDHRARDLLADDYEAGDASWVRGRFGALNVQMGSYETYDDALFGVKSFFGASVLVRDEERSRELAAAIADLQSLEESLPYQGRKSVDSDIPVGVYNVVADFGQARGTNTASILPNESDHARKYGRIILLRYNIMTQPDLFANTQASWRAAVALDHAGDLTLEGGFNRTLWHEVGHYLGPSTTANGVDLGVALAENSDLMEELKSDLVSLYVAPLLLESGYYDEAGLRAVYADGVRRTLQRVKPRRDQPYQTMQLMQLNFFLDRGLLHWSEEGTLRIDYDRYADTIEAMLREVLAIQWDGSATRAEEFIETWFRWDDNTHGALAARIREASSYRYRMVRYAVLGE